MESQQQNSAPIQGPEVRASTSTTPEGKKNVSRRQLKIMTFGEATLSFLNVPVINTKQAVEIAKRADARQYFIKTDGSSLINITYEADDEFTVALFNQSRWVTNLHVKEAGIDVGNVARAQPTQVATMFAMKNEARNVHTTFKVEDRSGAMLKRLDVRGHNTTWFSVFAHNSNMLMARPNGNWVAEKLVYLIDQMTTQAINNYRRSNGQEVLPANNTIVMRRRLSSPRAPAQEISMPIADATHSIAAQTDETSAQEVELGKEERTYEQHKNLLEENWHKLREQTAKYEEELGQKQLLEERQKQYYEQQKREVSQGLVEVGKAEKELWARRQRLQEEKEQFAKELAEFEKLKGQATGANNEQMDQQTQTYTPLWQTRGFTAISLSERFTQKAFDNKRIVMGDDGNMKVYCDDLLAQNAQETDEQ